MFWCVWRWIRFYLDTVVDLLMLSPICRQDNGEGSRSDIHGSWSCHLWPVFMTFRHEQTCCSAGQWKSSWAPRLICGNSKTRLCQLMTQCLSFWQISLKTHSFIQVNFCTISASSSSCSVTSRQLLLRTPPEQICVCVCVVFFSSIRCLFHIQVGAKMCFPYRCSSDC